MINNFSNRFIRYFRSRELFLCIYRGEANHIMKTRNEMHEVWEKKMKIYMKSYEDLFGIAKLSEMHDRVIEAQTNLRAVQEKRRKVQEEIFVIQKKLQEMQDILCKTSIGDVMYISVVSQVQELLKEQKRLKDVFSLYDQTEREQQTTLALAISNSQDHEKTYREKTKYISLITGIVGGILGLVGSSIHNWRLRKDIKDIKQSVSTWSEEIDHLLSTTKSEHSNTLNDNFKSLESLLHDRVENKSTNNQNPNEHIEELLSELETNIEAKLNKNFYKNAGLSASLIGSCTLLFSLLGFYITRNS